MLDTSNLTMTAEEAQGVSELIFERTITGGALSDFHDITTGIHHKTQIPFIGNLGLVGKKQTGCDRVINTGTIPLTEKFWDPELIGDRLAHCATDLPSLLKLFKKAQRINPDFYDEIGTEAFGVIIAKVEQAMTKMSNRLVWFGDKTGDDVTGGGVITNGTDITYFTILDGLFKQIFAEIPTTASNYVAIPSNDYDGVAEIASLEVTAAASASADANVTLDGAGVAVTLVNADTPTEVATKIRAATFTGWTTGGTGTTVTFTADVIGVKADAIYSAGTTGATGVMTTPTQGANVGQVLPANSALGIFRNMFNKVDSRFHQAIEEGAQPQYLVTREIYQNYMDQLEDKSLIFTLAEAKDGVSMLTYRGIPIKVRNDWDNNIKAYQYNGTSYNLPNRAILTVKENIPVGTVAESDLTALDSFYDKVTKKNYIDFDLKLDVKHLLDYMTVAAY